MCPTGKVAHPDRPAAERELRRCIAKRERGVTRRRECRVYLCPRCQRWHLTARPLPPERSPR